tara:strand:- start:572 stop:712 length:141 start_codon:yes stop_codon:yes gene_type:complete
VAGESGFLRITFASHSAFVTITWLFHKVLPSSLQIKLLLFYIENMD